MKIDYWTPDEIRKLENLYPTNPTEEISKTLKKSEIAVVSKAQRMKLKKNWRFRQKVLKEAKLKLR